MKTAVTVVQTKQVSMDEYKDIRTTKVFDDNSTIGEIKQWYLDIQKSQAPKEKIMISSMFLSDIED